MADERSGSEERLRSLVCETHGLRYDPQTQGGCVRCRAESASSASAEAPPTSARAGSGLPPIAWLVVAGIVVFLGIRVFGGDEPAGPEAPGRASGTDTVAGRPAESPRRMADDSGAATIPGAGNDGAPASSGSAAGDGWPTYEAVGWITIEDPPEDEPFLLGDLPAPDLDSVSFRAAGGELVITLELTHSVDSYAYDLASGLRPATVFVDSDLDPSTGERGFAGRPGFERAIQSYIGVKYDADADSYWWVNGLPDTPVVDFSCSHDVGTVSGHFLDLTFDPSDEEALDNSSCVGSILEVRVPYERLGVVAGQTVRLATEETMGSGKLPQYFLADVILTLE
jgi:hypothetical protein